jgi:hypothetical protein
VRALCDANSRSLPPQLDVGACRVQEELEQWAVASRQKEEDNQAMEKYKRADDARIKELTLHIEKLTKRVNRKKAELENEVTETQAAQIQLDKTAEDFRKLHECVPCNALCFKCLVPSIRVTRVHSSTCSVRQVGILHSIRVV